MKRYTKFPVGQALNEVVDGFKDTWDFPNCGGAIDGCHIPMAAPVEFHTDFYNRKGWYSMIIQAVADHKYRFTDIYTGCFLYKTISITQTFCFCTAGRVFI